MRKKGTSPLAVILLAAIAIAGLVIASFVKSIPAVATSSWSGLVFWLIFIVIAGGGGFLVGRFLNKGGRR